MRKVYPLDNQRELAWGFDKTGGFFVQVFDESQDEEVLLVNADQGDILSGFSIADEKLTYEKMTQVLKEYNKKAYDEFNEFIQQELPLPITGYLIIDRNGSYRNSERLETAKDLFKFIDKITIGYIMTDFLDRRVEIDYLFHELQLQ